MMPLLSDLRPLVAWNCDRVTVRSGSGWLTIRGEKVLRVTDGLAPFAGLLASHLSVRRKAVASPRTTRSPDTPFSITEMQSGPLVIRDGEGQSWPLSREIAKDVTAWLCLVTGRQAPADPDQSSQVDVIRSERGEIVLVLDGVAQFLSGEECLALTRAALTAAADPDRNSTRCHGTGWALGIVRKFKTRKELRLVSGRSSGKANISHTSLVALAARLASIAGLDHAAVTQAPSRAKR